MDRRLFVVCLFLVLLLTGCKNKASSFVPVTSGKESSAPAQVEMARTNVLKYVISSARLASLPQDAEWQVDVSERSEKEYYFRSGDWLIIVWLADADYGNQRVVIINRVENESWIGYVTASGDVVDTHYAR